MPKRNLSIGQGGVEGLCTDAGGGLFMVFGEGGGHEGPFGEFEYDGVGAEGVAVSFVLWQPVKAKTIKPSRTRMLFIF